MKKRLLTKTISTFLAFTLLLFSLNAYTASAVENESIHSETTQQFKTIRLEELNATLLDRLKIEENKVSEIVEIETDSLNTLTLKNKDGTFTTKVFQNPIKYRRNGETEFIDSSIKERGILSKLISKYEYENTANSIKTYFPKSASDGVLVEYDNSNFEMIPVTTNEASFGKVLQEFTGGKEVIEYADAFGKGYHLQYAPVNTGVKENIIIEEHTGINQFQYIIKTELVPKKTTGSVIEFIEQDNDEVIAIISETFAKDSYVGSDGKKHITYDNSYNIEKIKDNVYLLTMIIDKEFLESNSTVYPVQVDPIIIFPITSGINTIQSATVFSGDPSYNAFNVDLWNHVGYTGSRGEGITYVKVQLPDQLKIISSVSLNSAYYSVFEGSGNTEVSEIEVYNTTTDNWDITNINYTNRPELSERISSKIVPRSNYGTSPEWENPSGWHDFNITPVAIQWLKHLLNEGGYSSGRGFVLKAKDPLILSKHFATHKNTYYEPTLVFNYDFDVVPEGNYFLQNVSSGYYLHLNSSNGQVQQSSSYNDLNQLWNITRTDFGSYKIQTHCSNPSGYLTAGDIILETGAAGAVVQNSGYNEVYIVKNADGTFRLMRVNDDHYWDALAVVGTSNNLTAQVAWCSYGGTSSEKWVLIKEDTYVRNAVGSVQINVVYNSPEVFAVIPVYVNVIIQYTTDVSNKIIKMIQSQMQVNNSPAGIGQCYIYHKYDMINNSSDGLTGTLLGTSNLFDLEQYVVYMSTGNINGGVNPLVTIVGETKHSEGSYPPTIFYANFNIN